MSLDDFIDKNRNDLKKEIRRQTRKPDLNLTDADLRKWVLNDHGLYNWAHRDGVIDI